MTILQINKFYFARDEAGGVGRYYFELSKLLEENGHKIIPFAMQHEKNLKTKYSKYFVSEISTKPSWNIFKNFKTVFRFWWSNEARRKIKKLICENKIDVAHIHNIYHQISPSILPVLKKHKIPVVMTVHDYALISSNYNLYKTKTNFVQDFICAVERFLHHNILNIYKKNIDLYIAPSKFVRDKLIKTGFDKGKIIIIPHFVSTQINADKKADQHGTGKKYILCFGRLSEEKGIQILINAMKKLPDVKLKIAGRGYFKPNLESQVLELKLKNIEFLGFKNKKELQELILNSQFVIVPSLAPETFGLSALEAMAMGKVVLASNIGALSEIVDKEFLVKSGDAKKLAEKIAILTKDEKYVNIKGQENRKRVERLYDQKDHYKQILGIYNQFKQS